MPRISCKTRSLTIALAAWSSLAALPTLGQEPPKPALPVIAEGRSAAPLPDDNTGERFYERRRIKRTVPFEPNVSLAQNWDRLYSGVGEELIRAAYCNWDDTFLYLAVELPDPAPVRFDLDGAGDGWFRGAENLSVQINQTGKLSAQRFDTVQNRDHPVWAASPIPEERIQLRMGRTPEGAASVLVAIPHTELFRLRRRAGSEFGLRLTAGAEALDDDTVNKRALFKLQLADEIDATVGGVTVRIRPRGNTLVPGEKLVAVVEVKNDTPKHLLLKQLFFGGSLSTESLIGGGKEQEPVLNPGERYRREFRSPIAESAGTASLVLQGGIIREDGQKIVALATVDRVEPYFIELDLDDKPVSAAASEGPERRRLAVVTVHSRKEGKTAAKVTLILPTGWSIDGDSTRTLSLSFATEAKGASFKLAVPAGTKPGEYTIEARVEVGGRTYRTTSSLRVVDGAK